MSSYGQYTKHYFANDRRVSSRVGGGLPQGADAPHTTQLPSGRSWYDRAVAMKEQMERAFECTDMTEDRLEFATSWGVEMLVGNSSDGEAFFYHQNHQGSPVFVSTASGYLTEQQLLQAYGEVFASAQNAASWRSPYSFTGKEFDAESGLHYFGARYYLSSLGVWLSTDPLADQFANMSPYAYAANNPALFTDRWGLAPDPPAWWKAIVSGVREMFSFTPKIEPKKEEASPINPESISSIMTLAMVEVIDDAITKSDNTVVSSQQGGKGNQKQFILANEFNRMGQIGSGLELMGQYRLDKTIENFGKGMGYLSIYLKAQTGNIEGPNGAAADLLVTLAGSEVAALMMLYDFSQHPLVQKNVKREASHRSALAFRMWLQTGNPVWYNQAVMADKVKSESNY